VPLLIAILKVANIDEYQNIMMDVDLIKDLVCPLGKYELLRVEDFLICQYCGVKYPIISNIPVLLIDDAILPEGINSPEELKCMKI